jgi:uncharacterized protein (UPF0335 family)
MEGHNSVPGDQIRSYIERVERLEEEKRTLAEDIKEIYAEAKGNGFDVKILRKIVSMRRRTAAERREEQEILRLYCDAIQMELAL